MKKLAIFLDGTFNTLNNNTNVWRLRSLTSQTADQRVYYSQGVGTKRGEVARGGVAGYGIDDEIIDAYSPTLAIEAIRWIARSKRTFVVVLDEANNMIGQDEYATARPMAKAIKSLVNEGVFSVVVMGTDKAYRLFEADPELNSRKIADINLDPVNLSDPSERNYFFKFVGQIDRQMGRDGIVKERIGLIEDVESRAKVYDMSGGVVGTVVRILRIALRIAHNDKRRSIEWKDIEAAFYSWKTSHVDDNGKPIKVYDPFADGPKARTLAAVKNPR